jgi:Ca2+-binding RTX toxin-like protein
LTSTLGFITAVGAVAGHDVLKAGFTNQTLQSIGGNDTLIGSGASGDTFLGTAAGFAGDTIQGFAGTDVIDFSDIAFATIKPIAYTAATGKLVVSDATHSATVTMSGAYTLASFSAPQTDGHSGTLLKFV